MCGYWLANTWGRVLHYVYGLSVHSNLSCANILAQHTPLHSLIWELGQPGLGRILDTETQGRPGGLGYDLTGTSVELLALAQAVPQKQYRPLMAVLPLEPLWPPSWDSPLPAYVHSLVTLTPCHNLTLGLRQTGPGRRCDLDVSPGAWGVVQVKRCQPGLVLAKLKARSPDLWHQHRCFSSCSHSSPEKLSQPSDAPSSPVSVPQPCTRSGMTSAGKGDGYGLSAGSAAHTVNASGPCTHTRLTYFSSSLLWGKIPSVGRRENTH